MLILKQNAANTVPTPAAGKGTIFLSDSDVLSVKNSSGVVESFPTVGGANTQVIFNDDSALNGSANYTFDKDTNVLTVTGNVAATRVLTDNLLYANGAVWDLQEPAGSNNQIQFNNDGQFGATSNLSFDDTTQTLFVTGNGIVSATTLAGDLSTAAQPNITSVGTLTSLDVTGNVGAGNVNTTGVLAGGSLAVTNDALIGGNLVVDGNLTYINVENLVVEDPLIELGTGPNGDPLTTNDGKDRGTVLDYYSGAPLQAFMGWDNSNAEFAFGSDVSLANDVVTFNTLGNVRADLFIGNGSSLSAITGANVTGEVTYAATANAVAGANVSGEVAFAATANAVAGANVSGEVAFAATANSVAGANVSGEVGFAAVANAVAGANLTGSTLSSNVTDSSLTSVGTLTHLEVGAGTTGDFTGAKIISATANGAILGVTDNIGVVGEAHGDGANTSIVGVGVYGVGQTANGTRAAGVRGEAFVSATGDTGAAVGVRGHSTQTHAGGYNIGLLGVANSSGVANYALYLQEGDIASIENGVTWDLVDNSNAALSFGSTGKANIFLIETTDNAEGIGTTGYLNVTGNATVGGLKTDNLYYANGQPWDLQEAAGSNTQVQYNDNNDFGASSAFTFNSGTNTLAVTNVSATDVSATTVAGTLTTAAQPNITSVGTLTSLDVTGNVGAGNVSATDVSGTTLGGTLTTAAQPNITSVGTLTSLDVTGNVGAGNVSATEGAFTYVTGDGANLSAITGANVTGEVTYAATANAVAGANVSGEVAFAATANAVAGANVSGEVAFAATANAVAGANVSGTVSDATTAGTVTTAAQPNITSVGTLTGLGVNGNITATNITANTGIFTGDAGGLSNVVGANVTGEVAFAATANAVAGANVSGQVANALVAGTVYTNAQPNITSVGTLTSLSVSGNASAGNISATAGDFTSVSGNGSALTALNGSNISTGTIAAARVATLNQNTTGYAATVSNAAQPNITSVGTLTSLGVTGNISAGNVSATAGDFTSVSGNGSALSAITGANVTGAVAFATTANAVAGANVSGQVANALVAGTVYTAAQPNITSVGTLSSVTVSGNATVQGNVVTDKVLGRTNANLTITAFSGNNSILLAPTGTGVIDVGAARVVNGVDPTGAKDLATKEYVDTIASASLHYHAPCRVESPVNLNATYNNGTSGVGATLTNAGANAALVIDGITVSTNDRVLIYEQTDQTQNGVYVVTTEGDGSTQWVLTRATDADTYNPSDPDSFGAGDAFFIQEGATGAGELYVMNTEGTITFGSTNITFVQISSAQIYSAGTGLDLTGVTFSLADTAVTPASYGDAGNVSTFTVDQQGRLTAAGETAIQAPASGITGSTLSSNVTTSSLTSVGTLGSLSVTGNVSAGNVSATTGAFTSVSGNGSALTALNASNISTGTLPSGRLSGTYTITVSGSATTAGTVTTAAQPNITSVGTLTSLSVTGNGSFGNVSGTTGAFTSVTGSGAGLTSLNGSNITTGTIAAARVATLNQNTTGSAATVTTAAQPNITSVGTLTSLTVSGNANVGNIGATSFVGSGASLTSLNGSNITSGTIAAARVATLNQNTTGYAATVSGAAQANITSVGTLTGLTIAANGDIAMSGTGSQITGVALVSSTLFAGSGANLTNLNGSNISSGTIAAARVATLNQNTTGYAATVSTAAQPNITSVGTLTSLAVSGTATAATFSGAHSGSGASLTSLNGSNISTGTIAAARVATLNQNTTGYAATVSTAAQPNITSVGTLTSLAISGTNTLTVRTISTGANTTSGTITGNWSLSAGSKLNATYADLAEKYTADKQYEPGTVLVFGGDAELSATGARGSHAVAGIVTSNPAQVYNADLVAPEGQFVVELALIGRVPCRVIGPVVKGDLIITSENSGFGCAADPDTVKPGTVIGKAITSFDYDTPEGIIEVLVGKN